MNNARGGLRLIIGGGKWTQIPSAGNSGFLGKKLAFPRKGITFRMGRCLKVSFRFTIFDSCK